MPEPSIGDVGDIGGVFAGIVGVFVMFGKGGRWLLGWEERRDATRSKKLTAWHDELDGREARIEQRQASYQQAIEARLESIIATANRLKDEHAALRTAYQLIASALRVSDPGNPALRMADELLRTAFILDPVIPSDMTDLVGRIVDPPSKPEGPRV